ncbi:MAG: hypothetical protein R2742_05805 [Micropruina glycogenica]
MLRVVDTQTLSLFNGALSSHDPISYWRSHTGEAILQRHLGEYPENRKRYSTPLVDYSTKDSPQFFIIPSIGEDITTMYDGSLQTAKNAIVQQYGRFYVLRLARWMSDVSVH